MMLFEQTATHHLALIKRGYVGEGKNILESQAFEEWWLKFDEIYPLVDHILIYFRQYCLPTLNLRFQLNFSTSTTNIAL